MDEDTFDVNWDLIFMVDHEGENSRLGKTSIYVKGDPTTKPFKRAAFTACAVIVTMKQ